MQNGMIACVDGSDEPQGSLASKGEAGEPGAGPDGAPAGDPADVAAGEPVAGQANAPAGGQGNAAAAQADPGAKAAAQIADGPGLMPRLVLIVALAWTALLVAAFFLYLEVDAVTDFFPAKLGVLPFEIIWFGAIGGLVISLEGIFKHNRDWRPSYNYWHYMRPIVGAIIGTLGCLVFIVLTEAATTGAAAKPNPIFYSVVALGIGYREASFRALIGRLIDTVILPPSQTSQTSLTKTATDRPAAGSVAAASETQA